MKYLRNESFDLILSFNLEILPILDEIKNKTTKIIFDAREYYPKEFEDNLKFKLTRSKEYKFLLKNYAKNIDKIITVSNGLKDAYKKEFGLNTTLFMSLPEYKEKKLLYHI